MRDTIIVLARLTLFASFVFGVTFPCSGEEEAKSKPKELQVLKASIGIWDAEFEVWPVGLDSPSMTFKGVETNRAFGEYWIASDLDTEINSQTMKVHSIVGYDLDKGKLVGKVIDHSPYAASMTGDYDSESKTLSWTTNVKGPDGKPMVHKTLITEKTANERLLVLSVPAKEKDGFVKFMQIKFLRRK